MKSDPAGARTRDPYIKSVMLYRLSYGIVTLLKMSIGSRGIFPQIFHFLKERSCFRGANIHLPFPFAKKKYLFFSPLVNKSILYQQF